MTGNKKYDIFISYSRKDFNEVEVFKVMLQKRISGLRCWFDLTGIESGDEFSEKNVSAIDNSAYVLFMISDYSMASPWTKKEVTYAKNTGKRVIPILLKDSKIRGWFLFEYGLVDCINSKDSRQVDKLVNNLSMWTGKEITIEQTNQLFDDKLSEDAFCKIRILAEQGNSNAQAALGLCYKTGTVVPQDYVQAVSWLHKAAEQGNSDAQATLGVCYEQGHGVTHDYTQAVKWYNKAAKSENSSAQYNLGRCYYNGHGVKKDHAQAVIWYRKAAEQGSSNAQYNLGVCYYYGYGVKHDYIQAVNWYRKAAEQGDEDAIKRLKELHEQ